MLLALSRGTPVSAEIAAEFVTVGFPSGGSQVAMYRGGAYAPAGVRVTLTNEEARTVFLQVQQDDLDGDLVVSTQMVGLAPDLAGTVATRWLYFVPNPDFRAGASALTLQVLDSDGEPLAVFHNGESTRRVRLPYLPEVLPSEVTLVLSISDSGAGWAGRLNDEGTEDGSEFLQPIRLSHISPDLIPDHWHGLEAVDVIIWEAADPSAVSAYQQRAVLDWVRNGGRLLLAAGSTADVLLNSELGKELPFAAVHGLQVARGLPAKLLRGNFQSADPTEQVYEPPVAVGRYDLREGAEPLVQSLAGTQTYLARRSLGQGSIICLALSLKDLWSQDPEPRQVRGFFGKVLQLRERDAPGAEAVGLGIGNPMELPGRMHDFINFGGATTIYFLIAMVFVVVYGLAATWGSWFVLRSRGLLQHSWTVYFLAVAAASLISLIAVQVIRGVRNELKQLTIVDATTGTRSAAAFCYFGLKTPTYVEDFDFWLPVDGRGVTEPERTLNYLRPLSPQVGMSGEARRRFADTKRYRARTTFAQLHGVPIRATLKQVEGHWNGQLDGKISASIRLRPNAPLDEVPFQEGSVITSDLGHDLADCYLLHARLSSAVVAGRRHQSIDVWPLGHLPDGQPLDVVQRIVNLGALALKPEERRLKAYQQAWVEGLQRTQWTLGRFEADPRRNLSDWQRAIMLLSTFDEYEVPIEKSYGYYSGRNEIQRTHCRRLDRSADLEPGRLLLVGFARDDGPARLFAGRGGAALRPLMPKEALTVYRILIPVEP